MIKMRNLKLVIIKDTRLSTIGNFKIFHHLQPTFSVSSDQMTMVSSILALWPTSSCLHFQLQSVFWNEVKVQLCLLDFGTECVFLLHLKPV
jgi:hypothetical protein